MASVQAQNSFQLIAVINGTSINGTLQVDNGPLLQAYNKGGTSYNPDWESMAENKKPVIYPALIDITQGQALAPNTVTYKYNGVAITFGADNLSTNTGWEGVFKLVPDYSATIGGTAVTVPAMRIMKNLVPLSGNDNDRISCSGTIERNGQSIAFNELSTTVIIQQNTGSAYYLYLYADSSSLMKKGETTKVHAALYMNGSEVTDVSGYSFKWQKMGADGPEDFATTKDVTISTDDIVSVLTLQCTVSQGDNVLASNQIQIFDFSDPYLLQFRCTGATLPYIQAGQTAVVTPYIVDGSTGEENTTLKPTYSFYTRDNDGKDLLPTGKDALPFTDTSVQFTYEDVNTRAKGGITGYVTASF